MRIIIAIALLLLSQALVGQTKYQKDFTEFWTDFEDNYAYFERQNIDWDKVKEIYQPIADTVQNKNDLIRLFEQVVNELHNGHVSLNVNLNTSNRIIPSGSDMMVDKLGNGYVITDLRKTFAAELCGLKPGMQVVKFNGRPIDEQLTAFLPKSAVRYNDNMYEYALAMLFAGTHDKPREITIKQNGREVTFYPDRQRFNQDNKELLDFSILANNYGYIKINNSLANYDLIPEFDSVLDRLMGSNGLILDLTETPGGGNTAVARAIMGRFIERDQPYQRHEFDETKFKIKRSWIEYVSPRKKVFKNPLIVMVGHWTGSMGEGMAIGFDGMKNVRVAGTRMAGLLGAINGYQTTEMKIGYQIPVERLYHINGTPRENFVPAIPTGNIYETWERVKKIIDAR